VTQYKWTPDYMCSVPGCSNHADPRCGAHSADGTIIGVCDACWEPCQARDLASCVCLTGPNCGNVNPPKETAWDYLKGEDFL